MFFFVKNVQLAKQDILVQMEEDFPKVVDTIKSSIDLFHTLVHPNHFLLYQFKMMSLLYDFSFL